MEVRANKILLSLSREEAITLMVIVAKFTDAITRKLLEAHQDELFSRRVVRSFK